MLVLVRLETHVAERRVNGIPLPAHAAACTDVHDDEWVLIEQFIYEREL